MGVSAPKGSKERSESPLVASAEAISPCSIKIKKHGSAMRRFPKGDRKALWSPPQRRFPLAAIKTKKHGSAMRRFPKGDRKALWSPPQRRFPLAAIKTKKHGSAMRRFPKGDRKLRLFSCPLVASADAKPSATRKNKSHRKQKSRKKRKESRLPPRLCENRRLQKSNQANAIIPESHAAAH